MTTASTQPTAETAGETDGLAKAFEMALGSADLDESSFQETAMEPSSKPKSEPVDSETEPATEDASGGAEKPAQGKAVEKSTGQDPALSAPANWGVQRRDAFGKMNRAGQQAMLEMAKGLEAEFTRSRQELAEHAKVGQGVRAIITPEHRRQMAESGMDEVGGVSYLLRLNDYARSRPSDYARWFVQAARLDPRQLFPELTGSGAAAPQGGAQRQPDPQQQLYSLLHPVIAQVQGLVQERDLERNESAEQAIATFKAATGPDKALLRPHMPTVEQSMVRWLNQPELKSIRSFEARLQRAYDLAVNDEPQLRQQAFDSEVQKRLADKQKADDLAKARRAKAPTRSSPTGPVTSKPKGLEAALRQSMDTAGV